MSLFSRRSIEGTISRCHSGPILKAQFSGEGTVSYEEGMCWKCHQAKLHLVDRKFALVEEFSYLSCGGWRLGAMSAALISLYQIYIGETVNLIYFLKSPDVIQDLSQGAIE